MKPTNCFKNKHSLALQLFAAVEEQNLQEVITLLESDGADPNLVLPDKGVSPFHLVIGSDSYHFAEEATRVFLQHDGNPNVKSEDGLTPLHVAAAWGRTGLLLLLLLCGGDPWIRDCEASLTPLHLALREKHWETALVLQRHQLLSRQNHNNEKLIVPHYIVSLETVVVNAGDVQAEYAVSQDNLSPVMMSPVQETKGKNTFKWNIEPLQTQEYVQQWCDKEFSTHPVTSTPTRSVPLNTANYKNLLGDFSEKPDNYCSNMLCSNQMTPCDIKCGAAFVPPAETVNSQKSFVKNAGDTRKKLFLEIKKRFTGLKHSFEVSKNDTGKVKDCGPKTALSYFSRKKKKSNESRSAHDHPETEEDSHLSQSIIDTVPQNMLETKETFYCNSMPTYCNFKENVDEVDALPIYEQADISMEWIASRSCFTDRASPNSTGSQLYVTCDEGSIADKNAAQVGSSNIHSPPNFDVLNSAPEECQFKVPERPPRRKQLASFNVSASKTENRSDTHSVPSVSTIVSEKFKYRDYEAGVVLLESHVLSKPVDVPCVTDNGSVVSVPASGGSDPTTAVSEVSSVPASFTYNSEVLRNKLIALGEAVGPITSTTKRVYLRRLYRLQKERPISIKSSPNPYSPELQKLLTIVDWEQELLSYCKLEAAMCAPFESPNPTRRWREGLTKSSFNYLLLDPRISLSLPANVLDCDQSIWRQFISSVFYIGKGKRSRPYAHLYQAVQTWNKQVAPPNCNLKMKRIHEIWNDGYGVVCLHIFLNIIPVEAFTREAAMIDAFGVANLCNLKAGEYYGPAATWRTRQKRQLGCFLLYRAMRVFLSEGERQLRPGDVE